MMAWPPSVPLAGSYAVSNRLISPAGALGDPPPGADAAGATLAGAVAPALGVVALPQPPTTTTITAVPAASRKAMPPRWNRIECSSLPPAIRAPRDGERPRRP